jgi:stage II sporulation protein P
VDSDKNIVAVGAAIAEEIAKMGFGVIHDGTLHDYPVFRGAYARSADTVRAILREYPSIKVVLDVHRDGIESGGMPVAAVAEVDGKEAAQIMIVSPADNGNWGIPNFMENFRFASQLQSQMEQESPGLTRAILFQYCNYNLHLSPGALLIEVGSHGNTLEQAIYGGRLFGQSLGRLLTELAIEESG